jgi:hypothetical protein
MSGIKNRGKREKGEKAKRENNGGDLASPSFPG